VNNVVIVIERVPLVVIADFDGKAMKLKYYTFTSSETLPAVQSWQLYGTNDANMLGSDNPAVFTLLDNQTGIGFQSGVPKRFNVTTSSDFLYYIFYLESGFSVPGMNLEIQFHESEAPPTPTPTTPTPTVTPTPTPTIPPVADFEGSPRAGFVPLQVNFMDRSTGTISNWSWDFGDGNSSSERNPMHAYVFPGWFTVNLTVCNGAGCSWHSQSDYICALPSVTPTPTGTPRYYIKISGGSSSTTVVPTRTPTTTPTPGETKATPTPIGTGGPVTETPTPIPPTPTPKVGILPMTTAVGVLLAIGLFFRKRH
jgi:PKD repeat protein